MNEQDAALLNEMEAEMRYLKREVNALREAVLTHERLSEVDRAENARLREEVDHWKFHDAASNAQLEVAVKRMDAAEAELARLREEKR